MSRFRDSTQLELAFDRAIRDLRNHDITSEEYRTTLEVANKLHKMVDDERSSRVSKDVMATVAANLLGIFMIIKHEHVNVITSRATSLILRPFTKF